MITLILGGNRSGKTGFALRSLLEGPGPRKLLVTGKARDLAFREQIMTHKRERPSDLAVAEVDLDLPQALDQATYALGSVLVDSLDFWIFSCIDSGLTEDLTAKFFQVLSRWTGPELFLVSCEIGLGPLASTPEARRFAKELGTLNQAVAALADRVWLVTAGLPLKLK